MQARYLAGRIATSSRALRWYSTPPAAEGPDSDQQSPSGRPKGNWIKTLPGKGWFAYFRMYGPTQPYFDRSWVLPDIALGRSAQFVGEFTGVPTNEPKRQ